MSGLLSRFTNFLPNTTILSNDHNQELNRIVNLLNGTTTNLKAVFRTSDVGDPPLEADQLSTGPIQKWFQGGILKAQMNNNGSIQTVGATMTGELTVTSASPVIRMTDTVDVDSIRFDMVGAQLWRFVNEDLSTVPLSMSVVTDVFTFGQIPVGPAADPTTVNQLARKQYTDDKSFWGANWFIADPSTFPLGSFNLSQKVLIPKGNYKVLTLHGIFATGSASGSFSVELRKHPFGDQATQTTLGTITFNTGTLGVGIDVDITDHEFTEKDWLYIILTARTAPLQRDVTISVVGDKLGTIP